MFIIVMGVSGCGKTTVGRMLAKKIGCPFYDGDDFHPAENVAKMAAGIPLDDNDREGWLAALAAVIHKGLGRNESGVIACSALKERYRAILCVDPEKITFVYLKGSYELILARMRVRQGHYMRPAMLQSQFTSLEEPVDALTVDISLSPEQIVNDIMERLMKGNYALGILGLGVMGRSLAMNFARNGYQPIGYNLAPCLPEGYAVKVAKSLEELIRELIPPRTIFLMIPAGAPVDAAIDSLRPYLQVGDLIIDGGNSYFTDTGRRVDEFSRVGLHFIGMGISGGERGALLGPSLMPGGSQAAWARVEPMFRAIAAKTEDGEACVAWMGSGGAGHFVKMVHDGIEYGHMQLIAETYDLLHRGARFSNLELADILDQWNQHELHSYLVEITANILRRVDDQTGLSLVDVILDEAAQKGTGKWASQIALDIGAAIPTINAAVESRLLSTQKSERVISARVLGSAKSFTGDKETLVLAAEQALYASMITSYAQGLSLLKMAACEYNWDLDLTKVVPVWRAGCIVRGSVLRKICSAFQSNPALSNLLLDEDFSEAVLLRQAAWRNVVQTAVGLGIPMLATCASLAYFDAYRSERLPANLTQAQRDYFGAHTYRRIDKEGEFHTQWE